jgi:flavodoxin
MTFKKLCVLGFSLAISVSMFGCNTRVVAQNSPRSDAGNILIAYFSTNGVVDTTLIDPSVDAASQASIVIPNMELVAGYINETIGGTVFAIRTVKKYPVNIKELNAMGYAERDANARPELSTHVENMGTYNTIHLCYPNWCGTIPMAVAAFLEEYDFSGKTIIASCTHFGSGFGSSIRDIEKLCPDSRIVKGYSGSGRNVKGTKDDVVKWLKRL